MSPLTNRILKFISDNQPVTRRQVLNEFHTSAPNTVYRIMQQLKYSRRITTNMNDELIIEGTEQLDNNHRFFKIPRIMQTFDNPTLITNAYANQSPALKRFAEQQLDDPTALLVMLIDLLCIHQLALDNEFTMSDLIKNPTPNDEALIEQRLSQIQETLDSLNIKQ